MAESMDGIREGDGNIRRNPFLQPPILQAVFDHLSQKDLTKCRLVNKLWYNESLKTWRSNATIKLGRKGIASTTAEGSERTTSLGKFMTLWYTGDWGSHPFRKFNLNQWGFIPGDLEQDRCRALVAGHITSLTLEWCAFLGRYHFRRIIYQAFPNLHFLKMLKCKVEGLKINKFKILPYKEPAFGVHGLKSLELVSCDTLDSMMGMLSHFHKLESLTLAGTVYWGTLSVLLETIRLIRAQDQAKLPLKNFDVQVVLHLGERTASSMAVLKLYEQLKFPLQHLDIWLGPQGDLDCNLNNEIAIKAILQYHFSTLKQLQFVGNGVCTRFPFGFHLEKLEELRLPCRFSDSFNFLMYTPNLRQLDIYNFKYGDDDSLSMSESESDNLFSNFSQLEIGDWTLSKLTRLRFNLPLSLCNLRKLTKWMPNVETLWGLELDDVKFSLVCNNCKNLKYLEDMGCELTDEAVVGTGSAREGNGGEESPSGPNITKLKNLISFRTRSSKLTSASIQDGFLKLANLNDLTLGDSTEIDDDAKAALEKKKITLRFCKIELDLSMMIHDFCNVVI